MFLPRLLIAGAILLSFVLPSWAADKMDASTSPDLTGTWNIQFHPSGTICNPSFIQQQDGALGIGLPCPPFIYFPSWLTGSIDKATGNFSVSVMFFCDYLNVPITLTGTASQDGTTISGTWYTECYFLYPPGTFSGQLIGPATITFQPPPSLTPTPTHTPAPIPLTPTSTGTPAPPVGGISYDPAASAAPQASAPSSNGDLWLLMGGLAVAAASAIAMGGGALYVRRLRMR